MLNLFSPADLLGAGLYHEDRQVCQVHRARHRTQAATLLHHRTAGTAVWTPTSCGAQCHPGQGECACVCVTCVQPSFFSFSRLFFFQSETAPVYSAISSEGEFKIDWIQ